MPSHHALEEAVTHAPRPTVDTGSKGLEVLMQSAMPGPIAPGIHALGGQGNCLAIETALGVVLVDAGRGGAATQALIARLREITDRRIHAIVYSHGHGGYNNGVSDWLVHIASRGESEPLLIAHKNVARRFRRYIETSGLQAWLNSRQFRSALSPRRPTEWTFPTVEFDEKMTLLAGDRRIEFLAAPSETDDCLALWLPDIRLLYGGAAMIRSIPNVGTPLRSLRNPVRWADTLERLQALDPAIVVPEFGSPLTDPADIRASFDIPVRGLRYLRREVVQRMNAGMNEREILADMVYPAELFSHKYMRPIYGCPDYIVRDIYRAENGWWDRNPTSLHPAPPSRVAHELLRCVDPPSIIRHASDLAARGETQLALHVIDIVAHGPADHPHVAEAKALKARLCLARAQEVDSIVSKNLLCSSAEDLRGLPIGSTQAADPPASFSWD